MSLSYNDWSLSKPPRNVKVMVKFSSGFRDVCYRDDWNILHGEERRIIRDEVPVFWKKVEKISGEYVW